ncbi:MAG: hypothetical protein ACK5KR_09010 [Breznakia sp.]
MARSKWETHVLPNLEYICALARRGVIDKDIAKTIKVGESTFSKYKNDHSELIQALAPNKDIADGIVESALYKNAAGFKYLEEQAFKCKKVYYDEEGRRCEEEEVKTVVVERFRSGETGAQCFWLKNRRSNEWRDKHDVQIAGEINNPFKELSTKQVEALANAEIKNN